MTPGLLAVAAFCWPLSRATARLRLLFPTVGRRRWHPAAPGFGALAGALGALGGYCCGPGVGVAVVLAATTARARWRARREQHRAVAVTAGLAQALRALVAELRAGAHPAVAAQSVAAETDGPTAAVLTTIARSARLGGDIGRTLALHADETPAMRAALTQLGNAWELVSRHGLPLANVLDAARTDLEHRARFAKQLSARMAGPRSAAAVLAGLPVLGLLLGEAMGAHPLRVLTHGAAGQLLAALGAALVCAGITWSARLTDRTVLW